MTTLWKAVLTTELFKSKSTSFSNCGGCSQRFSVFSKFGQNEPKGSYFRLKLSNQPKIVYCNGKIADLCEKQKKLTNFSYFGCVGMFRAKKMMFLFMASSNFQPPLKS